MVSQMRIRPDGKVEAPLAGVRVLDLSHVVAGPYCTMLLADAGAEVIKIERPKVGEMARSLGPFVTNAKGEKASGTYIRFGRNKKSLTLDLTKEEGKRIFKELVKISDVVVENFIPGVMKKLGIDYPVLSKINPRLIYASISGYGQDNLFPGPYVNRPSFNLIAQAMGGIMEMTGAADGPPMDSGVSMGDLFPGALNTLSILLALRVREATGIGQQIDTSMYDAMISMSERAILNYHLTGVLPTRGKEMLIAPHGVFKTKDGYVVIAIFTPEQWSGLCRAIGREDLAADPSLKTGIDRARRMDTLGPIIEGWTIQRTKKEATDLLLAAGAPMGPVQNAQDILECPHAKARHMIAEFEDPVAGKIRMAGNPLKMSRLAEFPLQAPPTLGRHTEEILSDLLKMTPAQMKTLRTEGVL